MSSLRAGFGKADLSVFEPGMPMLGWGLPDDVPRRVAHPLFARALAVSDGERTLVYVVADLCFVSAAVRSGVLGELGRRGVRLRACDVMLTATHTHAGPNGYSHAFFYDLSALGFSTRVYGALVGGICDAVARAIEGLEPAYLSLGEARVAGDVIQNRSIEAHRHNPEATPEGVDRSLLALRVDGESGEALGVVSFFALHATSIHAGGGALHPDHKGLAAARMEAEEPEGFVALFAQGAAGDVSPNVRWDATRRRMVGLFDTDEESARHVADAQVEATRAAMGSASDIAGPLDAAARHVDLEERFVPERYGGPARTERSRIGVGMARGTAEGPGPLAGLPLARGLVDPKITLLETGPDRTRRLLGRIDPTRVPLPHPAFAYARRVAENGGLARAWIPSVLPIQLLSIGSFTIAGLPNEPTTVAGLRLRRMLEARLGGRVHVQGYANAYSGYLTTPEEYVSQRYEGAYTLFGPHTLGAFRHAFDELAERMDGEPRDIDGPALQLCSEAELSARSARVPSTTLAR